MHAEGHDRIGRGVRNAAWALAAASVLPATTARGDVTAAYSPSGPTYTYTVSHVPDFDQRRTILPNTGNMYCVPTASVNWAAYFANHGASWVAPGPGNWASQALFTQATGAIGDMGGEMGTDELNGTGGAGAMAGLMTWLPFPSFVVVHEYSTATWSPGFHTCSMPVFNGGYVIVVVGWYTEFKFEPELIQRAGGHALSLSYGARSGPSMEIGWRDPASDDGVIYLQSPFTTEKYPIDQRVRTPLNIPGAQPRTMSKVVGFGSAYIDEYFSIHPLFALSSQPGEIHFDVLLALSLFGSADRRGTFSSALGTRIIDLQIHADLSSVVYIAEAIDPDNPPQLWWLDPVADASERITVPMTRPERLCVGRRRGLYVIDNCEELVCIDLDLPEPAELVRVPLPSPADAMVPNDATDEIALLSVADRRLLTYPWHLDADPEVNTIPAEVPLGASPKLIVGADPTMYLVASEAADDIFMLRKAAGAAELVYAGKISDPLLIRPKSIDVADNGDVFASSEGKILQFRQGEDGTWALVADPVFPDAVGGRHFRMARSSTNFDPAVHEGPEWNHVLPEEAGAPIFDCVADLDGDGLVSFGDLLLLLAAWGPCPPDAFCDADFDFSGDVAFADLLQLLSVWGSCPNT